MKQPILDGILESPLDLNGFGFVNFGGLLGTFQAHSAVLDALAATSPSYVGFSVLQLPNPSADSFLKIQSNGVPVYVASAGAFEAPLTFSAPLVRTSNTISIPAATGSVDGYLGHADWNTFTNKVGTARAINTTAPITGGGDLSADRTIAIAAATGSVNGYLTSTDWTTFNSKQAALGFTPENVANKVAVFSSPTDAQYPSAKLVSDQLVLKVATSRTVNGHPLSSNVTVTPTDLALVIGTNVQAYATNLDTWATKTPYAGTLTVTAGKTFNITGTLTVAGTDGSTLNIGTGGTLGTVAYTNSIPVGRIPFSDGTNLVDGSGIYSSANDINLYHGAGHASIALSESTYSSYLGGNDTYLKVNDVGTGYFDFISASGTFKWNGNVVAFGTGGTVLYNGGALGAPASGNLANCTFPTLNQDTTGSAAKWTTARNLAGNSVDGSANVAFANKFIIQGTADSGLSAAQFLGALGTGIIKNTTTTGILSIAVAGDFPTLNQSTTGSAATLTAPRAIYGNNFDGSAALGQVIASTYGGTGNGFTKFFGPATSEKIKTLSNASDTILELAGSYTPTGTWTNLTLVTPALGTPSALVLTNATSLPVSSGISGLGSGIATFLGTPTSANLKAALTDELGDASGKVIFALGTLAIASGKTATFSNTLTFAGTDGSTLNIGAGGTLGSNAYTSAAYVTNSAGANVIPKSNGTNLVASNITDDGTDVSVTAAGSFSWNGGIVLTDAVYIPSYSISCTISNDNAPAGNIGQYVSASVVQGSAVSLVTATPKTVASISLTAGDWDVTAIGSITGASTGTEFDVAIGATTNSMAGTVLGDSRCQTPTVSLAGADATLMIAGFRVSLASTTTYYLIVQETFTIGSPKAYGRISARRVR